jgi:uncharacterized membrane protein YphA (DoxX/SURF4 family)
MSREMEITQPKQPRTLDTIAVLARWLLGAVFVYMGLNKALHIVVNGEDVTTGPIAFLKLVRQYDLVRNPILLNSIAATLPWFEIFCGLLLLTGVAVRGAALMLLVMLVPFTIVILKHGLDLAAANAVPFCAIKFDCGCGSGEVVTCHKLAENCGLIFLSAWLLGGRGRPLSARFSLFKPAKEEMPTAAET